MTLLAGCSVLSLFMLSTSFLLIELNETELKNIKAINEKEKNMSAPNNTETKQDKTEQDQPEIRVPKNKNSEYVRERLIIFNENEALLKAKTNAKNRARILLPRL